MKFRMGGVLLLCAVTLAVAGCEPAYDYPNDQNEQVEVKEVAPDVKPEDVVGGVCRDDGSMQLDVKKSGETEVRTVEVRHDDSSNWLTYMMLWHMFSGSGAQQSQPLYVSRSALDSPTRRWPSASAYQPRPNGQTGWSAKASPQGTKSSTSAGSKATATAPAKSGGLKMGTPSAGVRSSAPSYRPSSPSGGGFRSGGGFSGGGRR